MKNNYDEKKKNKIIIIKCVKEFIYIKEYMLYIYIYIYNAQNYFKNVPLLKRSLD